MDSTELKLKLHLKWLRDEDGGEQANLREADLRGADLREANLREADLREANLDFSSGLFFGCKTFRIKANLRLGAQLAYHFCKIEFDDPDCKNAQEALKELANKFHRVDECGRIP
jgi:uncharacterized protein YjbI with pentapeptide repeats